MFGLGKHGFKRKKYSDIVESMQDRARDIFGEEINLNNNSFVGMLINVVSWALSLVWELAEKVYFSKYVDFSEGNNLDLATRNSGITRRATERATGTAIFDGEVPEGFLVASGDILFKTIESGLEVRIQALEGGVGGNLPVNSVGDIVTPIPGVESFTCTETTGGRDTETDAELRIRFFSSLASFGSSTVNSIIAELLKTEGVRSVSIEEIEGAGYYEGIRAIILGGEPDDIAQAILNKKAIGIKTIGGTAGTAKAENGQTYQINFDYATEVKISVDVTLTTDSMFPSDGEQKVKDAIRTYISALNTGEDVIYTRLVSSVFKVSGVIDLDVEISETLGVMGKENISIASDAVATLDEVVIL